MSKKDNIRVVLEISLQDNERLHVTDNFSTLDFDEMPVFIGILTSKLVAWAGEQNIRARTDKK